jgi:predicted metal-dependent HD superfamily phosphohydrolase
MDSLNSVWIAFSVPSETSSRWMADIKRQYSEEKRYFHNVQMLEKKLQLIEEFAGDESFRNALILATLFQYFHYDVKCDQKKENCESFKVFVDQTGIKDVSVAFIHFNLSFYKLYKPLL